MHAGYQNLVFQVHGTRVESLEKDGDHITFPQSKWLVMSGFLPVNFIFQEPFVSHTWVTYIVKNKLGLLFLSCVILFLSFFSVSTKFCYNVLFNWKSLDFLINWSMTDYRGTTVHSDFPRAITTAIIIIIIIPILLRIHLQFPVTPAFSPALLPVSITLSAIFLDGKLW